MEFLKNYWYPLVLSSEVSTSKPYKISLLGDPLVLFRDSNGRVICLHDACPHQGAPLSMGKVQDGNIVCPYHGWQFGEGGECKKIPSIYDTKIPKSSKCRFAYPTEEQLGVVWVFAGDVADVPLRLPEGCTEDGWVHDVIVRNPEVPHKIMIAGAVDFAHFPFVHTNSIAKKQKRQYLRPLDVDVVEYEHGLSLMVKEPDGNGYNDFVYSFEPSCLVRVSMEFKPGWRLIASDYFVPLTENTTRVFIFEARNWLTWNPIVSWQLRRKANKILDEDLPIMVAQTERHNSGDGYWNSSVKADLLCLRYRQWYERQERKFADKSKLSADNSKSSTPVTV